MTTIPPITGSPLDYVPIDAPTDRHVPDYDVDRKGHKRGSSKWRPWNDPDYAFTFKAPAFRRALIAGVCTAAAIGVVYVFPAAVVAGLIMAIAVWGGGKLADRLNDYHNG